MQSQSMIKPRDVANLLNIKSNTLLDWRRRGIFVPDYITPTGRYFYSEAQISDFMKSMRENAQASRLQAENESMGGVAVIASNA